MQGADRIVPDHRFTADLAFFCLPDLLQLLAGIRASGLIIVRSGEKSGVVNLHDGKIADAYASGAARSNDALLVAAEQSSAAIWRMVEWTEGEVVFDPGWTPRQPAARLSVGEVLMEGLSA